MTSHNNTVIVIDRSENKAVYYVVGLKPLPLPSVVMMIMMKDFLHSLSEGGRCGKNLMCRLYAVPNSQRTPDVRSNRYPPFGWHFKPLNYDDQLILPRFMFSPQMLELFCRCSFGGEDTLSLAWQAFKRDIANQDIPLHFHHSHNWCYHTVTTIWSCTHWLVTPTILFIASRGRTRKKRIT